MAPRELFHRARLSLLEFIDLAIKLFIVAPLKLFLNLLRTIPQCLLRGLQPLPYIYCTLIRTLVDLLTPTQIQFLLPPAGTVYVTWLAKAVARAVITDDTYLHSRLRRDIELLPDGRSTILWLGDRTKATKFVLFLHGGGYIFPLDAGHLNLCRNVFLAAGQETGEEVAVAILQYSLCPGASYPTQLFQVISALALLLDRGISPADIVLGGDSCGGHMTAALLVHLVHPHTGAREVVFNEEEKLAGAFMASPWLSSVEEGLSFRENKYLDMISTTAVRQSTRLTLRGLRDATVNQQQVTKELGWAMPGDIRDESWWDGLDSVVDNILVTVGRSEILRDEVVEFTKKIRAQNIGMEVNLDIRPWDAHDFILVEGQVNRVGDATRQMKDWYKNVLQG